jgi:formylglycine-generating enzyme required for sulfatase activity
MKQMRAMSWAFILLVLTPAFTGSQPAHAADANGFEWCDITAPGNAAYPGNRFGVNAGRGSVAYSYRMAKHEVTTGQWLEFYNTFSTQSDALDHTMRSNTGTWPTLADTFYPFTEPGDRRVLNPNIPNAGRVAVKGMSWRIAALYCNWLHHDRSSDWNTIQTGAYDARTFGQNPDGTFTDQLTRSAGARFWIPSLDEWMKAVYFDPANGGVWWNQPNSSNTPLVPGYPGMGQTSATLGSTEWIPTGSYPDVRTPWGLLDASGSASEWTEEVAFAGFGRLTGGSGDNDGTTSADDAGSQKAAAFYQANIGVRIASVIPNPSSIAVMAACLLCRMTRSRRDVRGFSSALSG